ncbi:hypothetical protein KIW84_042518 [Lathyrus oleraceus]|uniref:Uncharacterized protein n=1 Tax=Pisum sativum TaxID=3888 RepID=A0A9D4XCX7_PEA|nr:hypothetical protein KIW84_042518 [Pisum sativum]
MLRLGLTTVKNLGLGDSLHIQLNSLAITNRFSVAASGAMSKVMFYLSVTPSRSNTLVSRRPVVTLRLTLDSGATYHVTDDLDNLSDTSLNKYLDNLALHRPYIGLNSLFMGNCSGLNITHSGTLLHNDSSLSNDL